MVTSLLLVAALMFSACTTTTKTTKAYSGPELPRDKVAMIVNEKREPQISIVAVDGRKGEFDQYIAVKPGKHTVAVNLTSCRPSGLLTRQCRLIFSKVLSFQGVAGRTYLVGGSPSLKGIWIEELETLQVVVDYYLE